MKLQIKSLYLLCFATGAMLLSSCEDFLDRQEDEKLTFEKIWESRNTIKQYWLNAMSFLPNYNGGFIGDNEPYLGASDECTITYDRGYRSMNFGSWNASNVPYYKMDKYYKGIRECNIFMQNVYKCSDPLATQEQLDEWYWQARFARAYYYFSMMCDYGPIFLIGDELLDFAASTEELYRPRNTWEECVNYVVSELTACAESSAVPVQKGLSTSKYGLATKGTCYAVISRLKLYSARDLFNGNALYRTVKNPVTDKFPELSGVDLFPQTYDANKWLEAAKAAKVLLDDTDYELYRAGNGDPYEDYYGITHVNWNSELIWTDRYNSGYSWGVNTAPTGLPGTAYGGVGPTQQQVDAYAMNNGRYPIISGRFAQSRRHGPQRTHHPHYEGTRYHAPDRIVPQSDHCEKQDEKYPFRPSGGKRPGDFCTISHTVYLMRYSTRMVIRAFFCRLEVLNDPPAENSSLVLAPVIWNTPIRAEATPPSFAPALTAIFSARTRASADAFSMSDNFTSSSFV